VPARSRRPDSAREAPQDAPLGGQAVLEGVMMRGVSSWAVAVRRAGGEVVVRSFPLASWGSRHRVGRRPIVRGMVALAESLRIGFQALAFSADAQLPDDRRREVPAPVWAGTIAVALCLGIGLFFVVPVLLTSLVREQLGSAVLFWLVEAVLRTGIFLGYVALLSRMRNLRRVFQYHGAEHKAIACFEGGEPLTPASAQRFPRLHPRCGTSFLLIVMVVAIFVFAPLGLPAWYVLVASRIVGVPLVAGVAFEAIRWAGRNRRRRWARGLMWPGLQLQRLTTREPEAAQLAVAIAALEAVLAVEDPARAPAGEPVGLEVVA
jgi:uncharacterized protein YqhQ